MVLRRLFIFLCLLFTVCTGMISGSVSAQSGTTYFNDTFTGTLGDTLLSHTADVGGGYAIGYFNGVSATNVVLDGAGGIYRSNNSNTNLIYYRLATATLPSADYYVQCPVKQFTATNAHFKIVLRYSSDKTGYQLTYNGATWVVAPLLTSGITGTAIGSISTQTLTNGSTKTVQFAVSGSSPVALTVTFNPGAGATVFNYTDSTGGTGYTAAGTVGLGWDAGTDTATTGIRPLGLQVISGAGTVNNATSYTLTGPTSGYQNVLNLTAFNCALQPNGYSAASTSVPLSDGGAGGTFYSFSGDYHTAPTAITSITLSTATPSVNFFYRPASTGAVSITANNSGGVLANPSPLTFTSSADPAHTYRIVCLGDSNTDEYNQTSSLGVPAMQSILSYGQLTASQPATPYNVLCVDQGYSGASSGNFAGGSPIGYLRTVPMIWAYLTNARYYQIMIGTNDADSSTTTGARQGTSKAVYKSTLQGIVNDLLDPTINGGGALGVMLHYPPYRTDGLDFYGLLPQYCAAIDELVATYQAAGKPVYRGADVYDFTKAHPELFGNPIPYPTGAGDKHFSTVGSTTYGGLWAEAWVRNVINPPTGGTTTIIRSNGIHAGSRL